MALTAQKRRYAEARLSGMSKKESAIHAGCPEKTASQAASRLEKDAEVQAAMGRATVVRSAAKAPPAGDPVPYIPLSADDPLDFFKGMMNDLEADPKLRLEAAKALASFTVSKPGEKGKKEQVQEAAEQVASGRFGLRKPGQLRAVK